MYNSGDAAEQVVRMSLEGAEFALKITGSAAKNLAAALYTVLKDQKKTKGKARIEAMLREKRPLKVYTIKKEDCPEFAKQAKGYGILYAPIPVKKGDDTIDILVFEDDAARANRIVEKFKLTVTSLSIWASFWVWAAGAGLFSEPPSSGVQPAPRPWQPPPPSSAGPGCPAAPAGRKASRLHQKYPLRTCCCSRR